MSVLLPNDAKYVLFSDSKQDFHHEWDFTWSFTFKLDGTISNLMTENDDVILTETEEPIVVTDPNKQYAFCTFLSKNPTLSSALLGHYMGFFDTDENLNGEIAIAFDSTGLFAFPNNSQSNRIIIRDTTGVVYNETLIPFIEGEQTLRFRYINKNELAVDIKRMDFFDNIIRIPITTTLTNNDKIYPYFFYTSPVSSSDSNSLMDTKLYMKNFHIQGNTSEPTF